MPLVDEESSVVNHSEIAIIGLGYVGLPLAVEFGKVRPTIGFDIDVSRIQELVAGRDITLEVDKDELVKATQLRFSSDENVLDGCRIFIVTVPTPIDAANRPNLAPMMAASEMVGRHLKRSDVVIYESTVAGLY